jgi:hypothetical protein
MKVSYEERHNLMKGVARFPDEFMQESLRERYIGADGEFCNSCKAKQPSAQTSQSHCLLLLPIAVRDAGTAAPTCQQPGCPGQAVHTNVRCVQATRHVECAADASTQHVRIAGGTRGWGHATARMKTLASPTRPARGARFMRTDSGEHAQIVTSGAKRGRPCSYAAPCRHKIMLLDPRRQLNGAMFVHVQPAADGCPTGKMPLRSAEEDWVADLTF